MRRWHVRLRQGLNWTPNEYGLFRKRVRVLLRARSGNVAIDDASFYRVGDALLLWPEAHQSGVQEVLLEHGIYDKVKVEFAIFQDPCTIIWQQEEDGTAIPHAVSDADTATQMNWEDPANPCAWIPKPSVSILVRILEQLVRTEVKAMKNKKELRLESREKDFKEWTPYDGPGILIPETSPQKKRKTKAPKPVELPEAASLFIRATAPDRPLTQTLLPKLKNLLKKDRPKGYKGGSDFRADNFATQKLLGAIAVRVRKADWRTAKNEGWRRYPSEHTADDEGLTIDFSADHGIASPWDVESSDQFGYALVKHEEFFDDALYPAPTFVYVEGPCNLMTDDYRWGVLFEELG